MYRPLTFLAVLIGLLVASFEIDAQTNSYWDVLKRFHSKRPREGRIYGGSPANFADNAWQVALLVAEIPENRDAFFCGGTMISPGWVLTAAHCVRPAGEPDVQANWIDVLSGTASLVAGGSRTRARKVVPHPSYNLVAHDSDIALLQVDGTLQGHPAPIVESASPGPLSPVQVKVSGWGLLAWGPPAFPSELQYVNVPVQSREVCGKAYPGKITPNMFCAGTKDADSCKGDSGGPVVTLGSDPRLVGVVSWGMPGCVGPRDPGVYTRVASFLKWIESTATPQEVPLKQFLTER